jgi:hypothetical protein
MGGEGEVILACELSWSMSRSASLPMPPVVSTEKGMK